MDDREGGPERRSPYLPTGYQLDDAGDPDFAVSRREDGSEVGAFAATGADPKELERRAWLVGTPREGVGHLEQNANKVRTPLFPRYSTVRQLLTILDGVPKAAVIGMLNAIRDQTGTPQNPVDWSDPDAWIGERLSGKEAELARGLWRRATRR